MAAFYTSRVDNEGNELERRQSTCSISGSISGSLHNSCRSSSTFLAQASDRSLGPKSSVRYVNPAAYIEKSTYDDCDQSTASTDMTVKSSSHIVPSLDLQSEDNYSGTLAEYPQLPRVTNEEAYETWLTAKRHLHLSNAARRKQEEEEKKREKEERKNLAEKKFKEWVKMKQAQQQVKAYEQQDNTNSEQDMSETRTQISEQEAAARVKEWKEKKRLEEEQKREMKRAEEEERKHYEEQRRSMSEEAWKKWIAEAANKPKPVPLNRGMFTLRGTISHIYLNPQEWQQVSSPQTINNK